MTTPITEQQIEEQTDAVETLYAELREAKRILACALHEGDTAIKETIAAEEAEKAYVGAEGKLSAMRATFALQERERLVEAKRHENCEQGRCLELNGKGSCHTFTNGRYASVEKGGV